MSGNSIIVYKAQNKQLPYRQVVSLFFRPISFLRCWRFGSIFPLVLLKFPVDLLIVLDGVEMGKQLEVCLVDRSQPSILLSALLLDGPFLDLLHYHFYELPAPFRHGRYLEIIRYRSTTRLLKYNHYS